MDHRKCQQTARHCANDYWIHLSDRIQGRLQLTWATRAACMPASRRQLAHVPPRVSPSRAIGSVVPITDQRQRMERWVEHYLELYATQNVVSVMALNDELDAEPTEEEMSKAI